MRKLAIVLSVLAFLLGVFRDELGTGLTVLLACAFPVSIVVYAVVTRKRSPEREQENLGEVLSQNKHSKIPVEITKEDIEAYEREQLKELGSYKNDPSYNFDE